MSQSTVPTTSQPTVPRPGNRWKGASTWECRANGMCYVPVVLPAILRVAYGLGKTSKAAVVGGASEIVIRCSEKPHDDWTRRSKNWTKKAKKGLYHIARGSVEAVPVAGMVAVIAYDWCPSPNRSYSRVPTELDQRLATFGPRDPEDLKDLNKARQKKSSSPYSEPSDDAQKKQPAFKGTEDEDAKDLEHAQKKIAKQEEIDGSYSLTSSGQWSGDSIDSPDVIHREGSLGSTR